MQYQIIQKLLVTDDGLIAKTAITFMVRAVSAAATFGMNVVIARLLGVAESGIFFLSLTIILAASVVARFGMDNVLMRFISPVWEQGEHDRVLGGSLQGLGIASGIGVLVMGTLYLSADFLAVEVFNEPGLFGTLRVMAIAVVPLTMLWVLSGILKAVRLPAQASFVEAGAIPMISGSAMAILLISGSNASSGIVGNIYILAALIGVLFGLSCIFKRLPTLKKPKTFPLDKLLSSAYPLLGIEILNFVIMWSSSLFLGIYADAESVGFYNVAHRTATLIAFILIVFNSVTAPRFSTLYSWGKTKELEKLAVRTASLMSLATFPVLLLVLVFPGWILSIFGTEFTSAAMLLRIIAVGQFINVITGSVGYLLIMTGNERLMRKNVMFTTVLNLALNVVLVSKLGALGAAISTAVCLSAQNLIAAWFVYQRLGIHTIPGLRYLQRMWVM